MSFVLPCSIENEVKDYFKKVEQLEQLTQTEETENSIRMIKDRAAHVILTYLREPLYMRAVYYHQRYKIDIDELESLGYKSLLITINRWRPSKGNCKFSSYFWTTFSCELKNLLNRYYTNRRIPLGSIVSFETPLAIDKDLEDLIGYESNMEKVVQNRMLIKKVKGRPSLIQKKIVKFLACSMNYKEIAQRVGVSPSEVCKQIKLLRCKVKDLEREL